VRTVHGQPALERVEVIDRFLGMPASVVAIRSISVGVTAKSRGSFASLATTACPAAVVLDQILLSGWGGASQACGGIGVGASAGPLTLGCGGQGRASGRIEGRRHRRSVAENQGGGLGRDASGCWGHGCARWRQVRGRLRVWPRLLRAWRRGLGRDAGAAARMAGCPWRRVRERVREETIGRFRMEAGARFRMETWHGYD
jgi:hypothetical protein